MATIEDLETSTKTFFDLHWPQNAGKPPLWNASYELVGTIPHGDLRGCYALLNSSLVLYVGSGVGRGGGAYLNHGLGKRITAHVLSHDKSIVAPIERRQYKFQERWQGASRLLTIGFPLEFAYLALALEAYLIAQLSPPANFRGLA